MELGFFRADDIYELVGKLYNVAEILIVLEKNIQQDSSKLA